MPPIFPQARDLRFERVGFDLVVETVDFLDQGLAGDDAIAAHQQRAQDQGLAPPQQDLGIADHRLVAAEMQLDIAKRQHRGREQARPAQDRTHTRDQFLRLERLAEIVVGAAVEAVDDVLLGVLGGQHDDRGTFRRLAQRGDHLERIAVRQHPVDDREIIFEIVQRLAGIGNRADEVDDAVQLSEQPADIGADLRFVFDHERAHAPRPSLLGQSNPDHDASWPNSGISVRARGSIKAAS